MSDLEEQHANLAHKYQSLAATAASLIQRNKELERLVDRLTTCLIGATDQIKQHNSSASHVTSKLNLELWADAITEGRIATRDGDDPGDVG